MVRDQAGQILQGVQRLPPMADDKANVLALNGNQRTVFFLLYLELHIGNAHAGKNAAQIGHRRIRGACLDISAHLCRAAAEKTERLFYGKL